MSDQVRSVPMPTPAAVERVKLGLTSFVLVVTTIIIGLACISFLSATLVQSRISSITVDGVNLSLWKLNNIGAQWASLRTRIQDQSNQRTKTEIRQSEAAAQSANVEQVYQGRLTTTDRALEEFYHRISNRMPQLAALIRNQSHPEQVGRIRQFKDEILGKYTDLTPLVETIEKSYDEWLAANANRPPARQAVQVIGEEVLRIKVEIGESEKSLVALFNQIKPDLEPELRNRIENVFYEMHHGSGIGNWVITPIVTMPPEILALSLVVLMGVLGSALQITNRFFQNNQTDKIGSYFLRLSVGAIAALVIFIVAKAGVPVVADASRLGGDAPINPYFVSFLAIISGLLSENAIANVQTYGVRFFGSGSAEPSRWLKQDLSAELAAQKIPLEELATQLGTSEALAGAIIKGEEKADPLRQKTIAQILRKPQREIFTDMPPPAI